MSGLYSYPYFQGRKVHLGVCGSIAAYKAIDLLRMYVKSGIITSVALSEAASKFITPLTFESLGAARVYAHMFGGMESTVFGHLEPGAFADCFVFAPVTASTMSKLAVGEADALLAAQALAYEGPLVLAPAMNPRMWKHPATVRNKKILMDRGVQFVLPTDGNVACGDTGTGKLADLEEIYLHTLRALAPQDYAGKKVMVTLGPTREQWDGVRFWSNPSTGLMGATLAVAAWLRGATVHAVCGPGIVPLPASIVQHKVTSSQQMFDAANKLWDDMDVGIFAAAVGDFYPEPRGAEKFKKSESPDGFSINFLPNPDILATLGKRKKFQQRILGFAAETENLQSQVETKLVRKNADILAGNLIGVAGSGFGSMTNSMIIRDSTGYQEDFSSISKNEVAWRLLDWLLSL